MSGQSTLEYTFYGSASYYLLFEGIRRFLEIDWELLEVYKGNERLKIKDGGLAEIKCAVRGPEEGDEGAARLREEICRGGK